jgi:dihydropteroate synthase
MPHRPDDPASSHFFAGRPERSARWRLKTRTLSFGRLPLLMGVINATPDSFSDGGLFFDPAAAIDHGQLLAEQGAAILDVGGESTRPFSTPVSEVEELRRVIPVIEGLSATTPVPISIDTSKAAVAREAVAAGAEIINDIAALQGDPEMQRVAIESGAGLCIMHMQGTPQTMQLDPRYGDVVEEIAAFLARRRDELVAAGVDRERICLDPGIGFGKTHQHNLTLLAHCDRFHAIGQPLLVGPSRKGFIAKVLGDKQADRTAATVGVALALARQGVQIIRLHDIAPARHALLLFDACGGVDGDELAIEP